MQPHLRLVCNRADTKQKPAYILGCKKRLYDRRKAEAEEKLQRKQRGAVGGYKDAAVEKLYPDGGAAVIPAAAAKTGSPCPHCGKLGHKTSRTGSCSSHGEYLAKCEKDGKKPSCACHKPKKQAPKPAAEVAGAEAIEPQHDNPKWFDQCDSLWI